MRDQEQSRWAEMAKKDEEIASLNELFEKSSREKVCRLWGCQDEKSVFAFFVRFLRLE